MTENSTSSKTNMIIIAGEISTTNDLKNRLKELNYPILGQTINFEEAAELIERYQPDLILMDMENNHDKNNQSVAGIIREKRVEGERERSRSLTQSILESTADGILVVALDGTWSQVNRQFIDMWHIPDSIRLTGRDRSALEYVLDVVAAPEDFMSRIQSIYEQPELVTFDTIALTDGRILERYSQPQRLDGQVVGRVWSFRDVTERLRAEEALRESEERFRRTFATSPDAITVNRLSDGLYVDINEGFTQLTQFTRDDVIGRTSLDNNIWCDHKDRQKLVKGLSRQGYYDNLEAEFRRKDGSITTALMSARVISLGGVEHVISITRDISERKWAEAEKEKLHAQLMQAQKMEAVGTLAGGIAHDFNNLLQAMNGYTQILLFDKDENDPDYPNLMAILNAGNRAAELVRQLLLFGRKVESEHRIVDLNHELEQARRILERTIPRMVRIEVELDCRLWAVRADPVQMEQILLNIGANAADAMPEGGRFIIETKNVTLDKSTVDNHFGATPGRYVCITMTDTGHGMDTETLNKIFDPFFTTKDVGKGTGLGLASVYGIVKSHDGYITCSSQMNKGTTFKINLPAADRIDSDQAGSILDSRPQDGTETILLIDDESAIRDLGFKTLENFGYTVLTASSGEEALDIYTQKFTEIDLIIMDIGMPGMGGYKCLCEVLRMKPAARVIIASGYAINGQVEKSLEAGAAAYVGKPYQVNELLLNVRRVLDGAPGPKKQGG